MYDDMEARHLRNQNILAQIENSMLNPPESHEKEIICIRCGTGMYFDDDNIYRVNGGFACEDCFDEDLQMEKDAAQITDNTELDDEAGDEEDRRYEESRDNRL